VWALLLRETESEPVSLRRVEPLERVSSQRVELPLARASKLQRLEAVMLESLPWEILLGLDCFLRVGSLGQVSLRREGPQERVSLQRVVLLLATVSDAPLKLVEVLDSRW